MIFDATQVSAVWGGMVVTGYADDNAIDVQYNEDHVTPKTGLMGDTVYSVNGNRSGTVKLSLFATSASLRQLRNDAQNSARRSLVLRNAGLDGGFLVAAEDCMILKTPGLIVAKEAGNVEVSIYIPRLKIES